MHKYFETVALQELLSLCILKEVQYCSFCPSKSCNGAWKDASMVKGSGPEQMSPELENKAFSAKSTQYMTLKRHKESYNTELETRKRSMKQLES